MNHLMMARGRTDHDAKTNVRFFKPLLLSLIFIVFGGVSSFAQDRGGKTIICPSDCPGTCWYVIDLITDPPNDAGCFNAHLNMFYGSTGAPKCLADIDRSLGGSIKFTVCDSSGGAGEPCELSDANFPDGSPYPIPPGTIPDDSTKIVLSEGCYGAIILEGTPDETGGATYHFNNISSITADFNMRLYCYCAGPGGKRIVDSLKFEYGVVHDTDVVEEVEEADPYEDGGRIIIDNNDEESDDGSKIDRAETIQNEIGYQIESIYPNPVVDVINVRMTVDQTEEFQFTIVDQYGNWLQNNTAILEAGKNDIPINLQQNLQSGHFYYFLIHRESGKFSTTKIYMK